MDNGWWWVCFWQKMTKLNKLSCQKNTLSVLYLCDDGIVVCIVICLPEEFIWKPHILSHLNGFLLDWASYHIDLLCYLRHFSGSGTKHKPVRLNLGNYEELITVSANVWCTEMHATLYSYSSYFNWAVAIVLHWYSVITSRCFDQTREHSKQWKMSVIFFCYFTLFAYF